MKAKILILSALIIIVLVSSGCTNNVNLDQFVKQLPEVQAFLKENPNAEIAAVLWNKDYIKANIDKIEQSCLPAIENDKSYYRVSIKESDNEIITWIDEKENKAVCIYRKGGTVQNNTTQENETMIGHETIIQFCSKAQLFIQNAYYNTTTNELTIATFNTGERPLTGISVRITYQNETIRNFTNEDIQISYQEIKRITIQTDENIKQVAIQSLQCRGAQDLINRYDISGLSFQSSG
jgi:outer membrane murein-binding lipoprotein Lpp